MDKTAEELSKTKTKLAVVRPSLTACCIHLRLAPYQQL